MSILDFLLPQNMPGGSAYEKKQQEAAAAQADTDMDKKTAEEILGFAATERYSQADLSELYHNRIADDLNDGASDEELKRIDHAKAYLDSYFVEDPTVVIAAEEDLEERIRIPEKKEPEGPGLGEMAFDWAATSFENEEGAFDPPALDGLYYGAMKRAKTACRVSSDSNVDIPELSGDYPLWFQAVNLFVRRFPWRLAFAVLVLWLGLPWVMEGASGDNMGEILSYGMGVIGKFIVIIVLIAVNSIWGIITNIIRHALKWASDWVLERQIDAIAKSSLKHQI